MRDILVFSLIIGSVIIGGILGVKIAKVGEKDKLNKLRNAELMSGIGMLNNITITDIFAELEQIKIKHKKCENGQRIIFWSYVIFLIVFVISYRINVQRSYFIFFVMFIYAFSIENVRKNLENEEKYQVILYKNKYKDNFIPLVLGNVYEDIKYDRTSGIGDDKIRHLIQISKAEPILSKDYFEGKYKGVRFCQCTMKTKLSYVGVYGEFADYCGRIFMFETQKVVNEVYIYSKHFRNKPNAIKMLGRVETEDIDFNNAFDVSAKKSEDAFYILTPHLMDVLMDLARKYGTMGVLYRNGFVYVVFNQLNEVASDMDVNIFKPLDYLTEVSKVKNFFRLIDVLIEELSLKLYTIEED